MQFANRLWQKINPIFHDIAVHPFNVELADGTLSRDRFDYYLKQDIFYLKSLTEVFSLIANRATTMRMREQFIDYSQMANLERSRLEALFSNTGEDAQLTQNSASLDYSNFLRNIATSATLEEAVAAVLPCWWIYRELSRKMAENIHHSNPYLEWVMINTSEQVSEKTDEMIALVNDFAGKCSEKVFSLMEEVCEQCSKFEWRFWDESYKMQ